MTVALSIKVQDGVVLAADSASTLMAPGGGVVNVYNNANKISNLYKGLPIGMLAWGSGAIGNSSICTLAKDLRLRFMGRDGARLDWMINPEDYGIENMASRVREFFYDETYQAVYGANQPPKPEIGMVVAGYSAGQDLAEEWQIQIDSQGNCEPAELLRERNQCG